MHNMEADQLRRLSRLGLPAVLLAILFAGMAAVGLRPPGGVDDVSVLAFLVSPPFVALAILVAAALAILFVLGARADNLLRQRETLRLRQRRHDLARRLAGEDFVRRWDNPPRVVNRVRELRVRRALSPEDLAEVLDLGVRTLLLIEKGLYNPDYLLCARICDLFGEPVSEVFWVDDPPSP